MSNTQRALLAALALVGASVVQAQSSVTLYGRVHTTLEHRKTGDTHLNGLFNNSSRWGVRGTEDLGGGLLAGFQLESGFESDTGKAAERFFGRQSEVYLGGSFGLLRLGTFTAESYSVTVDTVSLHNHDTGSSADMFYSYLMRDVNKMAYRVPAAGGFTAEGAVSLSEKAPGAHNTVDLALNYGAGPLGLGLGYTRNKEATGVFGGGYAGDGQQLGLRASYATGPVTLGAYHQFVRLGAVDGGTQHAKRHAYRLAAMYTTGASELHVNVGRAERIQLGGAKQPGTAARQWTLGYNHNLSKRTKVYGFYTQLDNGANISYQGGAKGARFGAAAVGMRHNF